MFVNADKIHTPLFLVETTYTSYTNALICCDTVYSGVSISYIVLKIQHQRGFSPVVNSYILLHKLVFLKDDHLFKKDDRLLKKHGGV